MKRLKQYASAAIAAAVALVFLIVGALALTVLKPSQELASSVVASNALVMTRDGVLPLVAKDVRIDARSISGAPVALGVGTPGDVIGWIGDDAYTEVVGITSDRSVLKVEEHPGAQQAESSQSGNAAQSGAGQAASAPEASQSADSSQSASLPAKALETDLEGSDMWLDKTAGQGSATLALSDIPVGRSLIAVSAAGKGDLELTLTWSMRRVNTLAIIAFLGAGLFALISGVLVLSRRHLLQRRRERAQVLTERAGADTTQTQMIDTAQLAELIDAGRSDDAPSEAAKARTPRTRALTGATPPSAPITLKNPVRRALPTRTPTRRRLTAVTPWRRGRSMPIRPRRCPRTRASSTCPRSAPASPSPAVARCAKRGRRARRRSSSRAANSTRA